MKQKESTGERRVTLGCKGSTEKLSGREQVEGRVKTRGKGSTMKNERSSRFGRWNLEHSFKPLVHKGMETTEKLDKPCGVELLRIPSQFRGQQQYVEGLLLGFLRRKQYVVFVFGGFFWDAKCESLMRIRFSLGLSYKIQNAYCMGWAYIKTIQISGVVTIISTAYSLRRRAVAFSQ